MHSVACYHPERDAGTHTGERAKQDHQSSNILTIWPRKSKPSTMAGRDAVGEVLWRVNGWEVDGNHIKMNLNGRDCLDAVDNWYSLFHLQHSVINLCSNI